MTLFVARDEAVSGTAGVSLEFPQGTAPSPGGCLWASQAQGSTAVTASGAVGLTAGECFPSKRQKRSGSGTNLRNNHKTGPSRNPEDSLRGAVMEINTLGIFLLL